MQHRKLEDMLRCEEQVRRHNQLCYDIGNDLTLRNWIVYYNIPYSNGSKDGELDIFAYKKGYNRALIVEVKYNNTPNGRKKAKGQLFRAEEYCPFLQRYENISKMYAYHIRNYYRIHKVINKKVMVQIT